jgi:thiosulfate/3-mercaptopyruvate sulfurtransferase
MQALVDATELARHLTDPAWAVFDCRHDLMAPEAGAALYRASHIPGARFAHLDRDLSGAKSGVNGRHPLPSREAFTEFLASSGVDVDTTVVAYDASNGLYAARLWWLCRWIGHDRVRVLDGGLPAWQGAGQPLAASIPRPVRGSVRARPSLTASVETADVEANLETSARIVVDARAPERFRGDVEPLDPVAGHIPGAINRPMGSNLASDGRFKDASALRNEFDALLEGRPARDLIHSCGSGVTACHNLLAMEIAGLPGSALYGGSWSAWCADPARPVERSDGR